VKNELRYPVENDCPLPFKERMTFPADCNERKIEVSLTLPSAYAHNDGETLLSFEVSITDKLLLCISIFYLPD